jgi:hypothetical protein
MTEAKMGSTRMLKAVAALIAPALVSIAAK